MTYIEQLLNGENVEWKKLGEVCEIKTGKGVTKKMQSLMGYIL